MQGNIPDLLAFVTEGNYGTVCKKLCKTVPVREVSQTLSRESRPVTREGNTLEHRICPVRFDLKILLKDIDA